MTEHGEGLRAGTRIGEFEIVRELGAGGFAITYLAEDRSLGRRVAVKEYFPGDWGSRRPDGTVGARTSSSESEYAWGLERFVEEARVLARLEHPNIVKVYRIVEGAGTAYIAMEYVEGRSLTEEIKASGALGEARVREVVAALAGGLAVVHGAEMLHRDIKPSNVMVRVDGSPVLIDFGAARELMGRTSRSITSVLTPGYAPVEQYGTARDRQGPWTDIYALGALAYAALSGRVPDDATERMLEDRLEPVEAVASGPVSGELAGAVMSALTTDYRRRPQGVGEWLTMLGEGGDVAAVGGEGGEADRSAGVLGQTGRRRVSPLVTGGVAAVLLGTLALAVGLGRGGGDPAAAPMETEEAVGLSVEGWALVQRGLLELGHDPGEGDGLVGGGTRAALRAWQTDRGLEGTGYLTGETAGVLRQAGERAVADSILAAERAEEDRLASERAEAARQAEAQQFADALHFLIQAAESDDHFRSLGAWSGDFYQQLGPRGNNLSVLFQPPGIFGKSRPWSAPRAGRSKGTVVGPGYLRGRKGPYMSSAATVLPYVLNGYLSIMARTTSQGKGNNDPRQPREGDAHRRRRHLQEPPGRLRDGPWPSRPLAPVPQQPRRVPSARPLDRH